MDDSLFPPFNGINETNVNTEPFWGHLHAEAADRYEARF